jgi:hypothetical protein
MGPTPLRKRTLAALIPLLLTAGAHAAPAPASASAKADAPCACHGSVYSVINLDPEGGAATFLNERGQAAVGSFVFGTSSFFDGERVIPIGSLGGDFTVVKGLNNRGVVLAESLDAAMPRSNYFPVTWTLARGMRPLPNSAEGQAWDINDRNQVVGLVPAPGLAGRAVRWDPDGTRVPLGPLPVSLSEGRAINNSALAGGFADFPDGAIHATLWSATGAQLDLGTLGGGRAFTLYVNERGDAAGYADDAADANELAFFRSPGGPLVPIGAQNGAARLVAGLNDRGEVVGITETPGGIAAYLWSRARGLVQLPRAGAPESDVFDINNRTEMVGRLWRTEGSRAVLWRGLATPVDLNSRLHRIPAGLVLEAGAAINEAGTILAYSNAGLVMLRPGKRGTDAPVLGPVSGLPDTALVGQEVTATLSFIDNSARQTHSAVAEWTDSCPAPLPLVTEANGSGQVGLQYRFCAPGFQNLTLRVTDSAGRSTETRRQVMVNAPGLAALSGRGTLPSAAGGGSRALPLRFALWAPLALGNGNGAGAGASAAPAAARAGVSLAGPFGFNSEQVTAVTHKGGQVRLEGTGRYNGRAGYRFVVDASDGGAAQGADRMRVRISHRNAAGAELVDYDSGARAGAAKATPATPSANAAIAGAADGLLAVDGQLAISN